MGTLESSLSPLDQMPEDADAIVVLTGYVHVLNEAGTRWQVGTDTANRCLHAASLYRKSGGRTVVVCGGNLNPDKLGPTLAAAAGEFLTELGVDPDDLILEERSTTTYENAKFATPILEQQGIDRIVLVTDATHMRRSVACFEAQGCQVTAAPCNYHTDIQTHDQPRDFLPSIDGLKATTVALHEWLGILWYRVKGRI